MTLDVPEGTVHTIDGIEIDLNDSERALLETKLSVTLNQWMRHQSMLRHWHVIDEATEQCITRDDLERAIDEPEQLHRNGVVIDGERPTSPGGGKLLPLAEHGDDRRSVFIASLCCFFARIGYDDDVHMPLPNETANPGGLLRIRLRWHVNTAGVGFCAGAICHDDYS